LYDRNALIEVVREKALQFGDFTLASGKKASFYLDCRCVTLDAQGANLVAAGMIQSWLDANTWPDAVGGMAVGAVPIAASILTHVGQGAAEGKELRGFFCRKEAKDHGKGKQIEGPVKSGDQVVIVEDVVTTGGSSLKAIEACEAFGLKVTGVTAIIDRMAGGREAFESRGYPLTTLLTIRDFGIEPE
jgi:orotate phosphoribosyltransferase